jgi:DNA polymerase-3 subunit chi
MFLDVKTNQDKLTAISRTVQTHYMREEGVLIVVPNAEAAQYFDQLLWKMPLEGFLPHGVSTKECREPVVITTVAQNLNQALVLIHLGSEANTIAHDFQQVYDLYDRTHPAKEKLAQERFNHYKAQGYAVEMFQPN